MTEEKFKEVLEKEKEILNKLPEAIEKIEEKLNLKVTSLRVIRNWGLRSVVDLGSCFITETELFLQPVGCEITEPSIGYSFNPIKDRSPYQWVLDVANDIDEVAVAANSVKPEKKIRLKFINLLLKLKEKFF